MKKIILTLSIISFLGSSINAQKQSFMSKFFNPPSKSEDGYPTVHEAFQFFANKSWDVRILGIFNLRPYKYRNGLRLPRMDDGMETVEVYFTVSYKAQQMVDGKWVDVPDEITINDDVVVIYVKFLEGWIPQDTDTFFIMSVDPYHTKTEHIPFIEDESKNKKGKK